MYTISSPHILTVLNIATLWSDPMRNSYLDRDILIKLNNMYHHIHICGI